MDLNKLQASLVDSSATKIPPVEQWDPAFCGDIDIHIKRNGDWFYNGSPIGRAALVRLFASIIKFENDKYYLVTPVEKVGICVDDVPFVITQWQRVSGVIKVKTQTDDWVLLGQNHPVELRHDAISDSFIPYVKVRRNLWGRVHQNVFYQWAQEAEITQFNGTESAVMHSGDYTFSIGSV
ncbi:DUF1285 domain-containing protein [Alteromonas sp. ASW11-36]|uniref:DUF1285 domain-containing protein n=1 Tax=Alteromonas arenosi TaxID=3055817 RepID=A0ABT7T0M9_9ALTE|nr:DUF1285 domain-containing protein [Alteromonas sp. ASW11-36]MDM7861996.1 DUF1285 domain-containing protein [Alteromonas sp. ASW11-36]